MVGTKDWMMETTTQTQKVSCVLVFYNVSTWHHGVFLVFMSWNPSKLLPKTRVWLTCHVWKCFLEESWLNERDQEFFWGPTVWILLNSAT